MTSAERAVLRTLTYSALFHFPLTKDELWKFLMSDTPITKEDYASVLKNLPKKALMKDGFYTLVDNVSSIKRRQKNVAALEKKLRIAKHAAYYLSYIPTIQLIGLSGSLASGSAENKDDIDFFIITKKNTLFLTRLWIQAVLEMLNLRRKRLQIDAEDKICVNLLVDERSLSWPEKLRDIYTAYEIVHMKPLFERNNAYATFLDRNRWLLEMLPHAFDNLPQIVGATWRRKYYSLLVISKLSSVIFLEKSAAFFQKHYMKRHQTTETVTETLLAFHPVDYRLKTLVDLNTKLQQLGLLTNK